MMRLLVCRRHVRSIGIVLAIVAALLLLCRSWAGQPAALGANWGPRTGLCTRCFQIYWFMGGGDGSFHAPAGMLRDEVCPACDVSAGYEKPPTGTASSKSAGDARSKYRGVASAADNYRKRQGDLPADEYAGGKRQLDLELESLNKRWEDLKSTFSVLGAISDPGTPKFGNPVSTIPLDTARVALRDQCIQTAKVAAQLAREEQDVLLLETMLLGVALPKKNDVTSVGLGRLVALRHETVSAYRRLATALEPLHENPHEDGVQTRPYYQPIAPRADLLSKPKLAADKQIWNDACNSRIQVNALLNAVADNWVRYERATAQRDMRAAAGLSTRMIELLMTARTQGFNGADADLEFQRARLEMVSQVLKDNSDWKKRWDILRRQSLADKRLPKEWNDAWTLLGMTGAPSDGLLGLATLNPPEIEARLSERRGRLLVMHEVRTILQKDKLSWPEPFDLITLDRLERLTRRVFPEFPGRVLYHVTAFDGGWWAMPSGGTVDFRRKGVMHAAHTTWFLAPGKYDVWIPLKGSDAPGLPSAVRIYSGIEVGPNKPAQPLQKPKSLPAKKSPTAFGEFHLRVGPEIAPPFSWFLFPQDADFTEQAIKGTSKFDPLKVPVGKYDLYWYATDEHAPLVLARGLEIGEKKSLTFELDTGIRLQRGQGIPAHLQSGWWAATLPGQAPVRRVNWTASSDRLLVPPGKYDVYWSYGHGHLAVRIASSVTVKANSWALVRADTGLSVKLSSAFPKIHHAKGWLAAAIAGTDELIDLRFGSDTKTPLILPAGNFDLLVQFDEKTPPKRVASGIMVKQGTITQVDLESRKPR